MGNAERDLKRGNLTFVLHGKRFKGRWHLVRLGGKRPGDRSATTGCLSRERTNMLTLMAMQRSKRFQRSVVSGRSMEGIAGARESWGKSGARKKSLAEADDAVNALKKKDRTTGARTALKTAEDR